MFTTGHLIWIGISFFISAITLVLLIKTKPDIQKLMLIAFIVALCSEVIKFFSAIEILPLVDLVVKNIDGQATIAYEQLGAYTPMLGMEHLPFELCSIQIFFIAYCAFSKNEKRKHFVYALMFPTGTIGAFIAIPLSRITPEFTTVSAYFTTPRVYEYFIYHALLISLSLYVGLSKECGLVFADFKKALTGLVLLDIPTFYLNSIFSTQVFQHDILVGVTHKVNYFTSYVNPLGLVLTEKWQWLLYLLIRAVLAVVLITLLYFIVCGRRKASDQKE